MLANLVIKPRTISPFYNCQGIQQLEAKNGAHDKSIGDEILASTDLILQKSSIITALYFRFLLVVSINTTLKKERSHLTHDDVVFCESLIRKAGAMLRTRCAQIARPPLTREAAVAAFNETNSQVELLLQTTLATRFPHIHWSTSEFNPAMQQQPEFAGEYWITDAIDGALHFLQGFGFYSLSLGLIRNGEPVLAFVYDPERDELFHAIAGKGAFLNGQRIQVADKAQLIDAYVTTSLPSYPAEEQDSAYLAIQSMKKMMMQTFAVKMLGSVKLQLAYVACGRLDGFWEFGSGYGDYYDWLPGALIVWEAGGKVTDPAGHPFTWGTQGVLAANVALSGAMTEVLLEVRKH